MVPCAVATDTGGSTRLPAALCGVVGLKTTEGLLPLDGIVPLSHTLDTVGAIARSVEDAAMMLDAMVWGATSKCLYANAARTGAARGLKGMRLACAHELDRAEVADRRQLAAYDRALDAVRALGAELTPLPLALSRLATRNGLICFVEGCTCAWDST